MGKIRTLAALAVIGLASPALGDKYIYHFALKGSEEVPPVATTATGECTVTLDDALNQVDVSCTYSGLTSNANNAHIHVGAFGVSGAPVVNLAFTPSTSGTATVSDAAMSAANVTAMIAGNTYINIHSVNHSGGEIRGQVVGQIPAISTWGLGALGILIAIAGTLALRRQVAPAP